MAPSPPSIDPPPPPCTGAGGGAELTAEDKSILAPKTIWFRKNCQKHKGTFGLKWKKNSIFILILKVIHSEIEAIHNRK